MAKKLLFSITKKDFEITHIRGTGPGGQHKNKNFTGVRIKHPDSGAVGQATDNKSQRANRKAAFRRLVESKEFKAWHRLEVARRTLDQSVIERKVEKWMRPENLRVEVGPNWKVQDEG